MKLFGLVLLATSIAAGQVTTATFYGVVHDPSGGMIEGAAVRMTNEGTGITIEQKSDSGGEFDFDFVPIGSYTLQIAKAGFKAYQQTNLTLRAGQEVRQIFTLPIRAITEQVTISAQALL